MDERERESKQPGLPVVFPTASQRANSFLPSFRFVLNSFLFLAVSTLIFLQLSSPVLAKEEVYSFDQVGSKITAQEGEVKGVSTAIASVGPHLVKITVPLWEKLGIGGFLAVTGLVMAIWLFFYLRHRHESHKWKKLEIGGHPRHQYFAEIGYHLWLLKHLPLHLQPSFIRQHPHQPYTLKDNILILIFHPVFKALRWAVFIWLISSITLGGAGIYSLQHAVRILAASPVTDTFTDETKIATSTNITVAGGQATLKATSNWYDTNWTYRRKITFDNSAQAENLTNFPVLVKLNSSRINYSNTQDSGQDIRFTDSDGTTLLSYEIEKWDETGASFVWVKVPQIDLSSATDNIYIYYGNSSATDGQAATSVWDSNYVMVQHLKETSGTTTNDSTSNNNDGTKVSTTEPNPTTSGQVNGAQSFDGLNDNVSFTPGTTLDNQNFSISFWIYPNAQTNVVADIIDFGHAQTPNRNWVIQSEDSTINRYYYLTYYDGSTFQPVGGFGAGKGIQITNSQWQYITYTKSGTTVTGYKNGVSTWNPVAASNANVNYVSSGMRFMSNVSINSRAFNGNLDEVRISSTARSVAWIAASYKSEADTFNTFASEEQVYSTTPGTLTSINLLSGETVTSIDSFIYNLSAKPAGTGATIQFSQDNTNWYNSSGVLDGTDTLTTGVDNTISLSGLGWSGANFYYKVAFTSDGVDTPVMDDINVTFTSNQPPDTPTNSSPTNEATGQDLNVTLTGSAYSDPESDPQTDAGWQVDDDADFATPVWTRTAGSAETTTTVATSTGTFANELAGKTELDHNTAYNWRVRYSDGAWSSYSTSTTFTTNLVNTPTNSSPANGATVTTLTPLLEASAFSDDQTGHTHAASEWQVDDNSDFSSPAYDSGETGSGETSRAVPGGNLSNFTTYYWHVRYKDSSGFWSEYSATTNFEINIAATAVEVRPVFGNTTVDQGDSVKIDVQVINFTDGSPLNSATSIINIYNPSGSKIVDGAAMTYVTGSNGIYRYSYTVPATSGSYLYEVTANQGSKTGYGASNFEVRTIASDVSSAKSTVESEQTAQTAERTAQSAERTSQTAERTAQSASRTKVEDIQTRVTAVQSDVSTIKSDVSTIKSDVSSAKSTIDSVWSRLQTLTGTLPSGYTGVYEQLVSIANTLSGLGVLKGSGAESLYGLSAESKDDVKYLKNKILDMQAAIEINRILLASGGQNSVFSTWYTFHSVVLNMLIANPTDRKAKIPFKAYLPKEAKQEHIISSGGLKIEYDEAAGSYVALGEFELEGGESITREVEMKDIWVINEGELGELRRQAEELTEEAKKTAYSGQVTVLKNDTLSRLERILRKQKDATATPQDHILAFRENQEDLVVVKENLKKMTDLITSAGAGRGLLASIAGINTFMSWGIIIALVTGMILLGLASYSMWKHQMMIVAQMAGGGKAGKKVEGGAMTAGTVGMATLTLFSLPKIKWRTLLPWVKKILLVLAVAGVVFGAIKGVIYFEPWEKLTKQEQSAVMPVESKKEPSPSPSPTPEQKKVTILETETGWLNVRQGPGTGFDKMGRVDVDEEFVELGRKTNETGEEWVKIQVNEETVGWVLGKYVKAEK